MKILIELDTANPKHAELLRSFIESPPVAPPVPQPVAPPVPQPVAPPVPQPVAPPVPSATPISDLVDQLNDAYSAAFAKDSDAAGRKTTELRTRFGLDHRDWTEEQYRQAVTEMQSLLTF